jgi:predicted AlkP superfamily phosphohydrolase/phosphomutase
MKPITRRRFIKGSIIATAGISTSAYLLQRHWFSKTLDDAGLVYRSGEAQSAHRRGKKVLILGFDALDPQLLVRFVEAGKLPHFQALMRTGSFQPLATSIPPLSPVAWANFITGMNPGGHGLFDFIHRDPQTMVPYLSTTKTEPAKRTLRLGKWTIPLSQGKVTLLRQGKSFWETLEEHDIPTTIFRVPSNFPPAGTKVRSLSGMGTPDIQGTYGSFSFFTDEPMSKYKDVSGGEVFPVTVVQNRVTGKLFGPVNSFKKAAPRSSIGFTAILDPQNPVAKIQVQDHDILLNQGEWSPWINIDFTLVPFVQRVSAICRFYLKQVRPHFNLYVTPINMDPCSPAMPISTPQSYAQELCQCFGPFYTQGMPEDTKALSSGVLNDGEFLQQARIVLDERLQMFDYELERFKAGVLFFYFGSVDLLSHMFWRTMDPNHPAYDPTSPYRQVIEQTYQEMDAVLGNALEKIDSQTTLIVMSDHGFAPFYRTFNLNTWLKNEGYASLIDESDRGEKEFLRNVNWAKTRAYGLGLYGLYINLQGRESGGIVRPGAEQQALIEEIKRKLLAVRDSKTGQPVIARAYKTAEVYTGEYAKHAPDLIVGYNRGYRSSWETVLGKFPEGVLQDNTGKWSGDHCTAEQVPGVLLTNKPIRVSDPALYDLAPTVLAEFGIPKGDGMVGNSLF